MSDFLFFYFIAGLIFVIVGALDATLLLKAGRIQKMYDDILVMDAFDPRVKKAIIYFTVACMSVLIGVLWWWYVLGRIYTSLTGKDFYEDL